VDVFQGMYRLEALRRAAAAQWAGMDVLVLPTTPTIYRLRAIEGDPVRLNSNLGYYTNFMNLLDLSAIAVPVGFQKNGLPFGATLVAPAFADEALCALGDIAQRAMVKTMGATGLPLPPQEKHLSGHESISLAVCGAHMSGLPLNHQLVERGARLARKCRTAPQYRLYALTEFSPPRPGLVRAPEGENAGAAIEVEVWDVPPAALGGFVDAIPSPLGIGTVALEDGTQVRGFLCEAHATRGARDITSLGGWRRFIQGGQP
jgi:allophanate hydrolase